MEEHDYPEEIFDITTPPGIWQVYEERKRELAAQNLPSDVYERKLSRLCEELGV